MIRSLKSRFQPISRRLPLLMTALLGISLILFGWAGYRILTRTLLGLAGQRAAAVSARIAGALGEPSARLRREGTPLSRDTSLRRVLADNTPRTIAEAQAALDAERTRNPQVARVELWSATGQRLLASGRPLDNDAIDRVPSSVAVSPVLGPLRASHDTVFTELRLPVLGLRHDTLGVLREFTRISSGQSSSLLRDLVGGEATLYLGNASGDLWTDFQKRVAGPPLPRAELRPGVPTRTLRPDGTHWIGALAEVKGVPWIVWVALPQGTILAPARSYLLATTGIASIVILLGALGAVVLSRRIIAPLAELTRVAEDIAKGNYGSRAKVGHPDEIGRLSAAFNHMAAEVQTASLNQENQAVELEMQQAELEEANLDLHHSVVAARDAFKRGEEARRRTDAIIAGAMDCMMTVDHLGRIVDFNPAAERTFGYRAEDVIGQTVSEVIVPPAYREAHQRGLARYVATGEARILGSRVELPALRADGTEFPAELTITRVPIEGLPTFTCFLRDLTAQKQLEGELRQSQKIEAIGSLASGIAHDFNNILTVIVNYGELLSSEPALEPALRADVSEILRAANRATALTAQLLAFGRRQVLRPIVVDVNEVVRDLSGMLERVIREDIVFDLSLDANVSTILVDRGQLEQVLMNLVVNARDAMPHGGTLAIRTREADSRVILEVTDTGTGMDATTQARIFEPFFTTKDVGHGTGLGLSTVYGIVKQSGGTIEVESELGRGTTFRLAFVSYAGDEEVDMPPDDTPAPGLKALNILLVEDDPAVRASVSSMLDRLGHSTFAVSDAVQALALLRENGDNCAVVVSDAMMPGMNGMELARILHEERPQLPVVIVSGYAEDAVLNKGRIAPNTVFLEKPFTVDGLLTAIARAVRLRDSPLMPAD